jgi:hypothetical protein
MNKPARFQQLGFIPKLAVLWIALLVLPFVEGTLLGAKTYYFLYIGLGLVFVMYGLTIRSVFFFLQHTRREPVYIWIAFLLWSVFICSVFWQPLLSNTIFFPTRQSHLLRTADR